MIFECARPGCGVVIESRDFESHRYYIEARDEHASACSLGRLFTSETRGLGAWAGRGWTTNPTRRNP